MGPVGERAGSEPREQETSVGDSRAEERWASRKGANAMGFPDVSLSKAKLLKVGGKFAVGRGPAGRAGWAPPPPPL